MLREESASELSLGGRFTSKDFMIMVLNRAITKALIRYAITEEKA